MSDCYNKNLEMIDYSTHKQETCYQKFYKYACEKQKERQKHIRSPLDTS